MAGPKEQPLPPDVIGREDATEVLRAFVVDGGLSIAFTRAFEDPEMWGMLLVDIALPGINNGITLAERIRRELQIPHIFTTSFSQEEVIRQAVKTNPAAYLRKPVDPANLRAWCQRCHNTYDQAHRRRKPLPGCEHLDLLANGGVYP